MNVIEQSLADALSHGRDMAGLAGKLRDKLKAGVADMKAVYDEAEAFVDASVSKAKEGLAAFKDKVAEIEGEVKGDEAEIAKEVSPAVSAVIAETGAPAEHVEPAVQAHAEAVAAGSEPEVAHADAQAAAAQAGAEPEVAVQIADSAATQPADVVIPTTIG